jgi:hypothetical protein
MYGGFDPWYAMGSSAPALFSYYFNCSIPLSGIEVVSVHLRLKLFVKDRWLGIVINWTLSQGLFGCNSFYGL